MHPLLWFFVGAVVGAVVSIVFNNPIRKEIKIVTVAIRNEFTNLVSRLHSLIYRLEEAVKKLEAKL